MEEIVLRSGEQGKNTISDERLRMLLNYTAGIIAEVLGFALAAVIVLALAGVFK